MGRAPCCDKSKVKKGPWTSAEDLKLISFIQNHGHPNWRNLPKQAGLVRCGKSCRLRWINYLRPEVKRGNWTPKEEEKLLSLHRSLGNKWSKIASEFPGRTDNEIKNVWNTHLKKKLLKSMDIDNDENNISPEFEDSPHSPPYSSATSISSCISSGDIFNLHDHQDHPKQLQANANSTSHHQKENDASDVNHFWNTVLFTTVVNDSDDGDNITKQPWPSDMDSQTPIDTKCYEVDDTHEDEWLRYLENELGLLGDDQNTDDPLSL